MRRALLGLVALAAVAAWAGESRAQNGTFDDPFFAYYGFFLPRQAALAAQPRVQDTINQNFADNQVLARTNRAGLYDPNGGYGVFDNYDPNATFDSKAPRGAGFGARSKFRGMPTTNIAGRGPALYYNRAAQYYPSLRTGVGPNRNLAVTGRGVRGGGGASRAASAAGAGLGGGMGVPGPR